MKIPLVKQAVIAVSVLVAVTIVVPAAHAEVFTTTLGETFETPEANLSVGIKADKSKAAHGEKIKYTLTFANASGEKTITTDLSLIYHNLNLDVNSIRPSSYTGRLSNLTGYPWNFFFKAFHLQPKDKKTTTFTATVHKNAKVGDRLRMAAAIQEGEFRNTELIQTDAAFVTVTDKQTSGGSLASISDLNSLFRSVYGKNPTAAEWNYWASRLLDKSDREALKGAMAFHKAHGRTTGDTPSSSQPTSASSTPTTSDGLASRTDYAN